MIQDELRAALLLVGFSDNKALSDPGAMYYVTSEKYIIVRYHKHDVSIVYCEVDNPDSRYDFRSMPEPAFNFIKEKLT